MIEDIHAEDKIRIEYLNIHDYADYLCGPWMQWSTVNAPKVVHQLVVTRGPNGEAVGEKEGVSQSSRRDISAVNCTGCATNSP